MAGLVSWPEKSPGARAGLTAYAALFRTGGASFPQQRLYFVPEPQGHWAFRGIWAGRGDVGGAGAAGLQNELRPDSR